MEHFKDHFSRHASTYALYRPTYPEGLFTFLSSLVAAHNLAWDCATGNGQAALGLAPHFERIVATDASKEQIANAISNEKISYLVCPAETTPLQSRSVDLVTIAQAIHWLNFETFYREVTRTLRPGGILAVWGYGLMKVDPAVDPIIQEFYDSIVGPYWTPERRSVDERYATIPFPFPEIPAPEFFIEKLWDREDLIGYLETWSASRLFFEKQKFQATDRISETLRDRWPGDPSAKKRVRWKLFTRIGRPVA